ncbi:winged helix-turn-helix domain-containing protein [Candidatus Magnetaquicoccus inordinatus]|uniref:winged helix-turn-helix domain-containing protein n=1 Tax=Candidatus Magnetaquicoccus inordinatus TaxID=2496818 RepID=UPI00102B8A20|nr:response regulator [Candidatus Magnetaquicoccus inordinatus]
MSKIVLIVDDEKDFVKVLALNLRKNDYAVRQALNGSQALLEMAQALLPDLVLLDLQLPDISGLELCRRMRSDPRTRSVAILMLTAKGEEIDRVVGFEMGADDYMVKPFSMRELMLRIQALLRRTAPDFASTAQQELQFGLLRMDVAAFRVWSADREVRLTTMEFKLLALLLERRGRVQTREVLMNDVWGIDSYVQSRTVDVHIDRLRKKLGQAEQYIETVHGMGYRLRAVP